jgi:tetrahydromethanopterin S-methyltransferase subunit H
MNPQDIIALVQMVIQFLLQLLGKNPASVKAYIDGTDTNYWLRPFVLRYRQAQLKVFTRGYAISHGLNAEQVHASVLAQLKCETVEGIASVANQLPAK